MKDNELQFERSCHVLYSGPCKKEIRARIAQHYPEAEREAVWERVQRQYVDFLSNWRTDLGGKKNFHNGSGGKSMRRIWGSSLKMVLWMTTIPAPITAFSALSIRCLQECAILFISKMMTPDFPLYREIM